MNYIQFHEQFKSTAPAELLEALDTVSPTSVRYNPLKNAPRFDGEKVSWCNDGLYLPQRPVFTTDPLFHAGAYYVQEASSMFVGWIMQQLGIKDARILDLCAAPGGKTTQLATHAAVMVSNEVIRSRAKILSDNVQRWGSGNIAVTNNDPKQFGERAVSFFDVVVVDTPCSGEGMFRKDAASRSEWSPEAVELCASRSRRIVNDVWSSLRQGGVMIYSTCTFNEKENEENLEWICSELGAELIEFNNVPQGIVKSRAGYRFFPHLIQGEGFYVAAIRKHGDEPLAEYSMKKHKNQLAPLTSSDEKEVSNWTGKSLNFAASGTKVYGFTDAMLVVVEFLRANFNLIYSGVMMGEMIRGSLKPEHALATYYDVSFEHKAELDLQSAVEYLRRGNVEPSLCPTEGINLITYNNLPIGWAKRIGNRVNNLYPQHLRILHL